MAQQLQFATDILGGSGRPLHIAFVIDPLDHLKAWKDSTIAMMRAAERHGHEVFAID